jgi:hypothetical protein
MASYTATILLLISLAFSQTSTSFNYNNGGADWTGTCVTSSAQSPVEFDNDNVTAKED